MSGGFHFGISVFVTVSLLAVYQADDTYLFFSDSEINAFATLGIVESGELLFTPDEVPWAMEWETTGPAGSYRAEILAYDELVEELVGSGSLRVVGETYLVRRTVQPNRYANTFGWGVSISSTPIFALFKSEFGDAEARHAAAWRCAKLAGSVFVAGSAGLVYLAAARWTTWPLALLAAMAYGLGTSVWSTSSQTLWQHAPSEFFLALGTYAFFRRHEDWRFMALCGAAYAWATWCRQPSAVAVFAIGVYLLAVDRKALFVFVVSGLPFAFGMFAMNAWCYGSPWHFGELLVPQLATETTGSDAMWQTHIWTGLAGVLLSPSRGMFVYSPFLLFALWGVWLAWRREELRELRPLTLAVAGLWIVHAVYFDWWGGYSYGYRQIVDSTTMLAVLLAPVLPTVFRRRWLAICFVVLVAWSVVVQAAGAWAFDMHGWNNRRAVTVREGGQDRIVRFLELSESMTWKPAPGSSERLIELSVDKPEYRHRLWSITDNQIAYYLIHFDAARRVRRMAAQHFNRPYSMRRRETYENLADSLESSGRTQDANRVRSGLDRFKTARQNH